MNNRGKLEHLLSVEGKNYSWLLFPTGVVAVGLAVVLIWAEEHQPPRWYTAQASLVTALLLWTVMASAWWRSIHPPPSLSPEADIYYRAIHKLLLFDAIGFFAVVVNATRFDHWQYGIVAKSIGFGTLVAGAFFVLGVLLGYLFGLRPTSASQSSGEKALAGRHNPPHTNLEEIADWFTKLILGAGLVELTNMRGPLGQFAEFMASGVDPSPPQPNGYKGSPAVAMAIMLFFSASGILYGYLWTRYELAVKDTQSTDTTTTPNHI